MGIHGETSQSMKAEVCFILFHPETLDRAILGTLIQRFENKGFVIYALQARRKTEVWVRAYASEFSLDPERLLMSKSPFVGIFAANIEANSVAWDVAQNINLDYAIGRCPVLIVSATPETAKDQAANFFEIESDTDEQ